MIVVFDAPPIVVFDVPPVVDDAFAPVDVARLRPIVILASRSATMAMSWPVMLTTGLLPRINEMPPSVTLIEYSPLGLVNVPENGSPLHTYAVLPVASVIAAPPAGQWGSLRSQLRDLRALDPSTCQVAPGAPGVPGSPRWPCWFHDNGTSSAVLHFSRLAVSITRTTPPIFP